MAGAAGGVALILALNTVRIGTLGRAAASPRLVRRAPRLRLAGGAHARDRRATCSPGCASRSGAPTRRRRVVCGLCPSRAARARRDDQPTIRGVDDGASGSVHGRLAAVSRERARARGGGVHRAALRRRSSRGSAFSATATGNVLSTARGRFLVTQECISTPLIPVYLAAVCAYSTTWRRRAVGVLAALPLFIVLGIARLLVVALPARWSPRRSSSFMRSISCCSAVVVVFLAALWRHGVGAAAWRRALRWRRCWALAVRLRARSRLTRARSRRRSAAARHSTIRRARSRSCRRSRSACTSRSAVAAFAALGVAALPAGLALLGVTQMAGLAALHSLSPAMPASCRTCATSARWAVAGPVLDSRRGGERCAAAPLKSPAVARSGR